MVRKWLAEQDRELQSKVNLFSYGRSKFLCHIRSKHFRSVDARARTWPETIECSIFTFVI